ncbi:hypothetical protein, partial [Alistipes sp.]|uniref:hypothetical protein n=1 Tax=Alistipes sp. TaxID=1872444 RepID=UPI00307EBE10
EHLTTDQKVTGLSPVGVTEEGESKRLSFLRLGWSSEKASTFSFDSFQPVFRRFLQRNRGFV